MSTKSATPELLTATQLMLRLGVSKSMFYGLPKLGRIGLRERLIAKGLKVVKLPSVMGDKPVTRYTAESFEKLIHTASSRESLLC